MSSKMTLKRNTNKTRLKGLLLYFRAHFSAIHWGLRISVCSLEESEKENVEQEVTLLEKIYHPCIVYFVDSFFQDPHFYIVMEYCDAGDLYTYLRSVRKNQPITSRDEETGVLEWFIQIASAVQFIHQRQILHRDLKTQNIFLIRGKDSG